MLISVPGMAQARVIVLTGCAQRVGRGNRVRVERRAGGNDSSLGASSVEHKHGGAHQIILTCHRTYYVLLTGGGRAEHLLPIDTPNWL